MFNLGLYLSCFKLQSWTGKYDQQKLLLVIMKPTLKPSSDQVIKLIAHRNINTASLMCSGQIIYKYRISGHCQYNQFLTYYCLNKYNIISDNPSLWLYLTISPSMGIPLETSRPNVDIVEHWYLVKWSQPGTSTLILK